jgi:hypothetical protein
MLSMLMAPGGGCLEVTSGCTSDAEPIALTTAYQSQALAVAKRQIEEAGVRLAWVLNSAAAGASMPAA